MAMKGLTELNVFRGTFKEVQAKETRDMTIYLAWDTQEIFIGNSVGTKVRYGNGQNLESSLKKYFDSYRETLFKEVDNYTSRQVEIKINELLDEIKNKYDTAKEELKTYKGELSDELKRDLETKFSALEIELKAKVDEYNKLIANNLKDSLDASIESINNNIESIRNDLDDNYYTKTETNSKEEIQTILDDYVTNEDFGSYKDDVSAEINGARSYTDTKVSEVQGTIASLVNGAPEKYDTLKEIADYLESDEQNAIGLLNSINENSASINNIKSTIEKDLYTKTETDSAIENAISAIGLSDYATVEHVDSELPEVGEVNKLYIKPNKQKIILNDNTQMVYPVPPNSDYKYLVILDRKNNEDSNIVCVWNKYPLMARACYNSGTSNYGLFMISPQYTLEDLKNTSCLYSRTDSADDSRAYSIGMCSDPEAADKSEGLYYENAAILMEYNNDSNAWGYTRDNIFVENDYQGINDFVPLDILGTYTTEVLFSNVKIYTRIPNAHYLPESISELNDYYTTVDDITLTSPYDYYLWLDNKYDHINSCNDELLSHMSDKDNPHNVTKEQIGLGNVDNTSDADKPISTATQTALNSKANSSETGYSLDLDIDSTTYVVTMTLKNKNNDVLSTRSIDLPLESVVVNGSYNASTKKVILTLQSGSTVEFSVADLVSGLQSEITSDNKLDVNLISGLSTVATSGSYNDLLDKPTIPTVPVTSVNNKIGTVVLSKDDIGLSKVENFKAVSTVANQGLTSTEKTNARANIGAGTSSFSGSYDDLENKPSIPTNTSDLTNDSGFVTVEKMNEAINNAINGVLEGSY